MVARPEAPAAVRNREAILDVIKDEFRDCKSILEVGSGTGQHAIFFASKMPWLNWQTSDLAENHPGIIAWLEEAQLANVASPYLLDVEQSASPDETFDAVFSANTSHIMSFGAVECMFKLVAKALATGGSFCLYGPFNLEGEFTSDSNRNFDASLKSRNSAMGIRNLEDLDGFAKQNNLHRKDTYAMPANNMLVVWQKSP
jgi:cyclopropane fatty-acyl-phospholipid synthase-like methyltransferase